ncbi:syndecan-4 isoform X2 [Kryptolebias marmoratus]|uniref:syndecan-4 isoform X2 n=1 Tax=Kryptolebias marmoratus TaxID=37003 RepID=UPI0018ACCB06|nr:syndecan-4 isoform X2 [Kryptolebias marmoratus]
MIRLLCLVLVLSASVFSESARETETWMPMSTTQTVAMSTSDDNEGASGDSSNDFGFTDNDDEDYYEDELSGSGEGETTDGDAGESTEKPVLGNDIPGLERTVPPTINEVELVKNKNEIALKKGTESIEDNPSNVLMSQASEGSIFTKTEVLAALIAGTVGLMFAVLLILLLIYRMKKKDEGSYDLGKKPIYKKAPTTEIYA